MADADTKEDALLDKMIELTGVEREDDETAEAYKGRLVRHFADKYPNTDEGNAAFEKLDEEVVEWVNGATEVARNNRGARSKKPLPEIGGLEEDEVEKKSSRRGKAEKEPKKAKEPKEPREPKRTVESNRFYRVAEHMIAEPGLSADDLVTKAKPTGYSERSIRRVHEAYTGIHAALKKHGQLAA